MDENKAYFDNISGMASESGSQADGQPGAVQGQFIEPWQPVQAPGEEKGSGKGLFFGGVITGLAGALLVVAICYLGFYIQEIGRASCRERV